MLACQCECSGRIVAYASVTFLARRSSAWSAKAGGLLGGCSNSPRPGTSSGDLAPLAPSSGSTTKCCPSPGADFHLPFSSSAVQKLGKSLPGLGITIDSHSGTSLIPKPSRWAARSRARSSVSKGSRSARFPVRTRRRRTVPSQGDFQCPQGTGSYLRLCSRRLVGRR